MSTALPVAALPFVVAASQPGVWHHDDETGAVAANALAHTDLYINPGGSDSGDAASMLNAATLLGTPPGGDSLSDSSSSAHESAWTSCLSTTPVCC